MIIKTFFLFTDAIINPIRPIPHPISSTVVFGLGASKSITAFATFSAPAEFDQKFVLGASWTFNPPTISSNASDPTRNVVSVTAVPSYLLLKKKKLIIYIIYNIFII